LLDKAIGAEQSVRVSVVMMLCVQLAWSVADASVGDHSFGADDAVFGAVVDQSTLVFQRAVLVVSPLCFGFAEGACVVEASGTVLPAHRAQSSEVGLAVRVAQKSIPLLAGLAGVGESALASVGGVSLTSRSNIFDQVLRVDVEHRSSLYHSVGQAFEHRDRHNTCCKQHERK